MQLSPDQIVLVVNQDAGRVNKRLKVVHKLARHNKIKIILCGGADLDYTIRNVLDDKKIKRLIVGGGDGSLSTAASLVLRIKPSVEIAVLPLGTANYYAKSLGCSRNINKAFEVALNGSIEKRHLCRANGRDFLLGVNVGATSRMFAQVTDAQKERFGRIAYFRGVFRVLLQAAPPEITIRANNEIYNYAGTELVILNQNLKGPLHIMPDVKGTEPYFEIITYGLGRNILSPVFAVLMFAITFGHNQKYLKRIKATKATITTKNEQPVAIDGDSLETTPIEIELLKKPVKFVRS